MRLPPPPPPRDLRGSSTKPQHLLPDMSLYTRQSLEKEGKGESSLPFEILKGVPTPVDKHLLSSLPKEEIDRMLSSHVIKVAMLVGELFTRLQVVPPPPQGDARKMRLEDHVECLLAHVAKLKETKREAIGRYQQAEREAKELQKELLALTG
ncbi:UNVERIFIED_CONTAM: hypothetical protein Sindi_1635800, partial [Sesamum indicum]